MTPKKILVIGLITLAVVVLVFVGYHVILHIKATVRMKELSQQLEQKIQTWEKKSYHRPPLYGEPIPGNAAEFYEAAEAKIETFEGEVMHQVCNAIDFPNAISKSKDKSIRTGVRL